MPNSYKNKDIKIEIGKLMSVNRIDFPKETLERMWKEFDFEDAENRLYLWQRDLSKAAFKKNDKMVFKVQEKIVTSLEARALAVRHVSEVLKSSPGIDNVKWITPFEKMKATIFLNSGEYKAAPLKRIVIQDKRGMKERRIGIPTLTDRAMQVLYTYALEPIFEATADRKSFAFRKGRSALDAHACLYDNLCDYECPEWVLITDIKNCYDSISHKWLLDNIPMNRHVLKEFLESGVVFNGELFPTDVGISLGANISPMLGNMTLDGLQYKLYDLQGEKITDFKNGYMVRFADDVAVTARTREDAEIFKEEIEKFAGIRGLTLSEKKTKIVNIKDGFDFLSRFYIKLHNQIRVIPSEKAVKAFEEDLEDFILNPEKKWTQRTLIRDLNAKLYGWATYHRVEESGDVFKHLDVFVNALLIKLMQRTYPNKTVKQLLNKYWYKLADGRYVFALITNRNVSIINLENILLVKHRRMDLKKNIFLDKDYFEEREEEQRINKVVDDYKKIWQRQNGKCYFCGKPINPEQEKRLIQKDLFKRNNGNNLVYVHEFCKGDELLYIDTDITHIKNSDIAKIVKDIEKMKVTKIISKATKYKPLEEFFYNSNKAIFVMKFKDIEEKLGFKLCESAYNYPSYWRAKNSFSNSWLEQGYEITRLDLKGKKVTFHRIGKKQTKLTIPQVILSKELPEPAKCEIEQFLEYIIKKYGLKKKVSE